MKINYEKMLPDELRETVANTPVAFVPLGSLEYHGWHMPLGNDALKAADICRDVAEITGGAVLPPSYFGFAGGHLDYEGSIMTEKELFLGNLKITLSRLISFGFKVIVVLTGHYPVEQVAAVKQVGKEFMAAHSGVEIMALHEPEAFPRERRADHAAKWETSILMHLRPELVEIDRLERHDDPVHGICGEDPRLEASSELGRETVEIIVKNLAQMVKEALSRVESD
ncbi:creatininase family protein [Candidatus Hydrogenedentota bacterium]